jgi:formylglycine-generating enzyme required for sulfatase activity
MVRVSGGTFTMGCSKSRDSDADDDESPEHQVTLSTYSIGETEVTQELWEAVMGSNPSKFKGAKRPVEQVRWNDCQEFIEKLNKATGKTFRLPTEAEWEYAARGGNKSKGYKYSGSNDIESVAWYDKNSYYKGESSPDYGTHEVATKRPNELGLYDMSGNVYEWCNDWKGDYSSASQTNPKGPGSGQYRVIRGGGWNDGAGGCRSSCRVYITHDDKSPDLGLRLVLSE